MNRIQDKFEKLKASGRKALIPYMTPEFPFRGMTVPLMQGLEAAGADMIEVGIPFSDPLADGVTIQQASNIAIGHGVNISSILESVREFRRTSDLPLILMGYINPIYRYGVEQFVKDAHAAGVDGLIVPDLPPEEASNLRSASALVGISNVFMIAPTTDDERIRLVDEYSTDFSYCVSVTGVTGVRSDLGRNGSIEKFLERVRRNVKKRFVVGFGISTSEHVQQVWQMADGAVVGSALLQVLREARSKEEAIQSAATFIQSLRKP